MLSEKMFSFLRFCRRANHEEDYYLADYGPIDIFDYNTFLQNSKSQFWKRWNQELNRSKNQLVKLQDGECSLGDFEKIELIGMGSFGHVYLVKNTKNSKFHALKAVLKKTVVESYQINNTRNEKLLMQCSNCPFILRLQYFFKDNSYLYFVLPFIQGGTLFSHVKRLGFFDENSAKFYLAQVILAVEYLHYFNFVYRDIKPENILLDHTGYVKLTDFGFCKQLASNERTYTLCGTPDYFAPEILRNVSYGKAVDWWAIGVLAYEITTGAPPFKEQDDKSMFRRILHVRYDLPPYLSDDLKDLITNTLQEDPTRRFGNLKRGVDDLKTHRWFKTLNWNAVVCRKAKPPIVPQINGDDDTRYFKKFNYMPLNIEQKLEFAQEFIDF